MGRKTVETERKHAEKINARHTGPPTHALTTEPFALRETLASETPPLCEGKAASARRAGGQAARKKRTRAKRIKYAEAQARRTSGGQAGRGHRGTRPRGFNPRGARGARCAERGTPDATYVRDRHGRTRRKFLFDKANADWQVAGVEKALGFLSCRRHAWVGRFSRSPEGAGQGFPARALSDTIVKARLLRPERGKGRHTFPSGASTRR